MTTKFVIMKNKWKQADQGLESGFSCQGRGCPQQLLLSTAPAIWRPLASQEQIPPLTPIASQL